ncbi:hypothetical protein [Miniphocaeibacter halophilus]|uniref:Uncharacterized protein n=1 Tax=Miniphocaeibacter halophilus TaxID=2931922 RepID=A0AC61MMZ4_9FIRM|nr:hypothetical protein [Miniphocaeibacter halophilus]QQK06970.1 hypothetical protein JFY71_06370 [Miniphocaeibacter halophilus]
MLKTDREIARELINKLNIEMSDTKDKKIKNSIIKALKDLEAEDKSFKKSLNKFTEEINGYIIKNRKSISVKNLNIINELSNMSMSFS